MERPAATSRPRQGLLLALTTLSSVALLISVLQPHLSLVGFTLGSVFALLAAILAVRRAAPTAVSVSLAHSTPLVPRVPDLAMSNRPRSQHERSYGFVRSTLAIFALTACGAVALAGTSSITAEELSLTAMLRAFRTGQGTPHRIELQGGQRSGDCNLLGFGCSLYEPFSSGRVEAS